MDYKVNQTVLYGAEGVCRIAEITEIPFGKEKEKYYILRPVYDENSRIMVTIANEKLVARMKPILARGKICEVFDEAADNGYQWIENDTDRKTAFKKILEYGETSERLRLLRLLYIRRNEKEKCGKKLHVADERILKEIEKILFDELALSMGIKRAEVKEFVRARLQI